MKLIVALVRPEKLEAVVHEALGEPGVSLLDVSKAVDVREPRSREFWRGLEVRVTRIPIAEPEHWASEETDREEAYPPIRVDQA